MIRRRGFLLILALFLTILIAVISLGLFGVRRGNYAASKAAVGSAQARALAHAGIEDIRVKLAKDPFFPTGIGDEQELFSYTERINNLDGELIGSYRVTVDRSHRDSLRVYRIESRGFQGAIDSDGASFTIYAELNLDSFDFHVWEESVVPRL